MRPDDTPDISRSAILLERYLLDGPASLSDPDVTAYVAAHGPLVREAEAGIVRMRGQLRPVDFVVPATASQLSQPVYRSYPTQTGRVLRHVVPRRPVLGSMLVATIAACAMVLAMFVRATTHNDRTITPSRTYVTHAAQRATITLPDGSRVILGPATTLRYGRDQQGAITVALSGQAYFTVTHDPSRAFSVRSLGITTRVLGTAFAVRAYPDDRHTQVSVAEGKVLVRAGASNAILLAGDVGNAMPGQKVTVIRDARIADVFGWTRGQFTFRNVTLEDMVPELERIYAITIRAGDPALAARRLTVVLRDEPASDMLRTLAPVLDATYRYDGQTVILTPR